MKLSKDMLRKLVLAEVKGMKNFGDEGSVEDVKAKEVEPEDLANTLEDKKDYTMDEAIARLKQIRVLENKFTKALAKLAEHKKSILAKI